MLTEVCTKPFCDNTINPHLMSKDRLEKLTDEALYSYNVYQIEGIGRTLFSKIEGDENTIMGLPVNDIKKYIMQL